MNGGLIIIGICISYFFVAGLSTTNILRLLKGSDLHVYSSKCSCPNCGVKIGVFNQTPIISYILNKGKCRHCKSPIPRDALYLEIAVFFGMTSIAALCSFSPLGVLLSFLYYELIKIILIIKRGKREHAFLTQYILSVLSILFVWFLMEFMSLLYIAVRIP